MKTTTPQIIGLTGHAGAGKDTVAHMLLELDTRKGVMLAFADALRAELATAFGVSPSNLTQRDTKEVPQAALALCRCSDPRFVDCMRAHFAGGTRDGGIEGEAIDLRAPRSPRQLMQWWGTEYRRHQHPGYWIEAMRHRVHDAREVLGAGLIVITDVRFADEATFVRSAGGTIWQVLRPGAGGEASTHVSESDGTQFAPSVVIANSRTLEHLRNAVEAAAPEELPAPSTPNLQDLRDKLLTPIAIERDADGYFSHPALPDCDEDTNYAQLLAAFGLELGWVSMENQAGDLYEQMVETSSPDCSAWAPTPPMGDGWLLIHLHDTEDGPYAWYVRPAPRSTRERKTAVAQVGSQPVPAGYVTAAAYDRLQALADSQAARLLELESAPTADGDTTTREQYARMFHAACVDLGAVNELLGLDPNDGGAESILAAIRDLQATPVAGITMTQAARDVLAERRRQIEGEDYDAEHDDQHVNDEIAAMAALFVMPEAARDWDTTSTGYGATLSMAMLPAGWNEPRMGDRRDQLVKGTAMGLAEIERIDRAAAEERSHV